jgi:hypothetical protein
VIWGAVIAFMCNKKRKPMEEITGGNDSEIHREVKIKYK